MPTATQEKRTEFVLKHNVAMFVTNAKGHIKPQFQYNDEGIRVLEKIREAYQAEFGHGPIGADGQLVDDSQKAFEAAYGIRSPYFGEWSNVLENHNLVVTAGKGGMSSRLNGAGAAAAFTYIAVGTGTTAPAAGDTTLQTETSTSGLARAAATCTQVTTTVTNDTAQDQVTFTVTGTVAVTESGVFNANAAGTMLCRQTFSAINVVNGDSLQITWKIQFT